MTPRRSSFATGRPRPSGPSRRRSASSSTRTTSTPASGRPATLAGVLKMINEAAEDAYRAQTSSVGSTVLQPRGRSASATRTRDAALILQLAVINQFYTPSWWWYWSTTRSAGCGSRCIRTRRSFPGAACPASEFSDAPVADYLVLRTGSRIRYQRPIDDGGRDVQARPGHHAARSCPGTCTLAVRPAHGMHLDEIEHAGQPGWPAEPSIREPRDIPAAILEHNLFGVGSTRERSDARCRCS